MTRNILLFKLKSLHFWYHKANLDNFTVAKIQLLIINESQSASKNRRPFIKVPCKNNWFIPGAHSGQILWKHFSLLVFTIDSYDPIVGTERSRESTYHYWGRYGPRIDPLSDQFCFSPGVLCYLPSTPGINTSGPKSPYNFAFRPYHFICVCWIILVKIWNKVI